MTEVLGYEVCRGCSKAVPADFWRAWRGYCHECVTAAAGGVPQYLQVLVEGSVIEFERASRPSRASRKGKPSKSALKRAKRVEKAKLRAMKGLRDRHWAEYLALLAMERQKLGLVPMPPEMAPYLTKEGSET
jgi:hypothetical protein